MPKILLLGKDGQVGWELHRCLIQLGRVHATGRSELDLTDPDALRKAVRSDRPDVVVNAAAYTDVDGAETDRDLATAVNARAPGILADEASKLGALLIHYSTDYVFDGRHASPYTETEATHPINHYGLTKLEGETAIGKAGGAHWVFRTSWVYGTRRPCFVTRMLHLSRTQERLQVVDDQHGSPTWCRDLAKLTARALEIAIERGGSWTLSHAGVYHVASSGSPSRLDLAKAILALDPRRTEQTVNEIVAAKMADFPTLAARPPFSALDSRHFSSTFGVEVPEWQESLRGALEDA